MDARSVVVDHRRILRAALLGVAAAGAAVVGGMLLGGSHASADDGSGLLDSTLGSTSQTLADTTSAVVVPAVQVVDVVTAPVTQPVAPVVQAVAQPVAPVVQAVTQPVAPVVQAIPQVSSVVTPIATQVDAVVAAVPVVGGLVTTPVGTVTEPIVDVVDDGGDAVIPLPPTLDERPAPGDGSAVASPSDASDTSDGIDVAGAVLDPTAAQADRSVELGVLLPGAAIAPAAAQEPAASTSSASPFGSLPMDAPRAPAPATPTDVPGAVAPAASAAGVVLIGDATHDSIGSSGAIAGALADDDDLPASVVGDHDTSPD